jgi:hypothetical protein
MSRIDFLGYAASATVLMTCTLLTNEPTPEHWATWARWAIEFGVFYGLIAVILVDLVAAQKVQSPSDLDIAGETKAAFDAGRSNIAIAATSACRDHRSSLRRNP